jgi:hypothetical protein
LSSGSRGQHLNCLTPIFSSPRLCASAGVLKNPPRVNTERRPRSERDQGTNSRGCAALKNEFSKVAVKQKSQGIFLALKIYGNSLPNATPISFEENIFRMRNRRLSTHFLPIDAFPLIRFPPPIFWEC